MKLLKTLLLWLLMAVLPLNAVAAAMGISCKAVHQQLATVASVQSAAQGHHAAAAGHAGANDHAVHHGDGHEMSSHKAAVSGDSHGLGHSTCSACSAFCVGAVAPPPAVITPSSPGGAEIVLISPVPLIAGFIPDGHKRPPRHLSI